VTTVDRSASLAPLWPTERAPRLLPLSDGEGVPLILVHPTHGAVDCYRAFAKSLRRPVWAIEAGAPADPPASIPALAVVYAELVAVRAPRTPLLLGGWQFGCVVAHELACVLADRGDAPVRLLHIDGAAPSEAFRRRPTDDRSLAYVFAHSLSRLRDHEPVVDPAMLAGESPLDVVMMRLTEAGLLSPNEDRARLERGWSTFAAHARALFAYQPRRFPGRALAFLSTEQLPEHRRPPALGWDAYVDSASPTILLPGNHFTIMHARHAEASAAVVERSLADEGVN
jgi:thioesterase domain-containing protein